MTHAEFSALVADAPVYQGFISALIGGAVSLFSGLSARSDAKKRDKAAAEAAKVPVITETEHTLDLPGLVKASEAAGFNPMTILAAGGMSAFTKSKNTTTGQNAMAAVPTAPSFGSVLANAASSAFNIYREDAAAERQIQAAAMSSFPARPNMGIGPVLGYDGYTAQPAYGKAGGGGEQWATRVAPLSAGAPRMPTYEDPTVTNPYDDLHVDPYVRDADAFEQRYGDIAQEVKGGWNIYQDFLYNVTGYNSRERAQIYWDVGKNALDAVRNAATAPGVAKPRTGRGSPVPQPVKPAGAPTGSYRGRPTY